MITRNKSRYYEYDWCSWLTVCKYYIYTKYGTRVGEKKNC